MGLRRLVQTNRCPQCLVHTEDCYCASISTIDLKTKVSIIMHKKERFLTSNTAMLSHKCLSNSELFIRGFADKPVTNDLIQKDTHQPLFLYPTDDAHELTTEFLEGFTKPINLIVPDGSWRQAKKVHMREKLLTNIPRVKLTLSPKSIYFLRRQKFEYGLCTHEAIAHALGIIEGEIVQNQLLQQLKQMVSIHLKYRPIHL